MSTPDTPTSYIYRRNDMPNQANGAFGSDLFNTSIPISGTQSNNTERKLPTPKSTNKDLDSGVPVSEHDKMSRLIDSTIDKANRKEVPTTRQVIHWKDMEKKADQALFLAQQGKTVNEIARLTGWSEGTIKTTFSSWKKKKLVTGRAARIEPQLHEDRMPDFHILFIEKRLNKPQIVEQYDYHPNVVDDAFYRLKREKWLSGSSSQPVVIGVKEEPAKPAPLPSPPEPMTIKKARAIIAKCFLEDRMRRDGIVKKYPEVTGFIEVIFKELIADGEILGSPGKPIIPTKIPKPVFQLPKADDVPPLREKAVAKDEPFTPKFEPLGGTKLPPSPTKPNIVYSEPNPLPERDPLPPQVKQWMDEAEQGMKEGEAITVQPNTDVSFEGPNGTTIFGDSDGNVDPTSEEAKRAAVDGLVTGMADNMSHSIDILLGKKPVAVERYDTMEDPEGVWDETIREIREREEKSVSAAPPPPFKNGMTDESPALVLPADTKIEFEDDGTFLHLSRMTECEEPAEVAPDPIEVGRLKLNNEELSVEALRERFDLLIQSLTLCGAERFDIDLSLKGWKP